MAGKAQLSELDAASNACLELCSRHGFATGHGDTVADIIREIDMQIGERLAAKPDEDGVREAVGHIEMAQSRLRAAMMGDEPCKPCVDLAASHLQEAIKALSTTGKPKP